MVMVRSDKREAAITSNNMPRARFEELRGATEDTVWQDSSGGIRGSAAASSRERDSVSACTDKVPAGIQRAGIYLPEMRVKPPCWPMIKYGVSLLDSHGRSARENTSVFLSLGSALFPPGIRANDAI